MKILARLRTNVIKRDYIVTFELYGERIERVVRAESEDCARKQIVKTARILSVKERREPRER